MKIYVPVKAIVDSLYIAVDNYSRKPYLVFYIKTSNSVPFVCENCWFTFDEMSDIENYTFYPFTTDLFHRLLAYIKEAQGDRQELATRGLVKLLEHLSGLINESNFHSISYEDLGNNQTKYQTAFWYAIANQFAPNFMRFDIRDFLIDFLFTLSNNPNITEYVCDVDEIERLFLIKDNPLLRNVGVKRLMHYISDREACFIAGPPFIILIVVMILEVLQKI